MGTDEGHLREAHSPCLSHEDILRYWLRFANSALEALMMPSKVTRLQKAAAIATVAAPIVAGCVGILLWLKANPHGDVTASTGGLAMGAGSTMNVVTAQPANSRRKVKEPSVYLECHHSAMPTRLPGRQIYVLNLWPVPAANGGGGLVEYFSLGDPPELKWPTGSSGIPLVVQHCDAINDGTATIFNMEMAANLQFHEVLVDKDHPNVSRGGAVTLARPWVIPVADVREYLTPSATPLQTAYR
jgi:hypothetical protein